jgi:hypothetical protein
MGLASLSNQPTFNQEPMFRCWSTAATGLIGTLPSGVSTLSLSLSPAAIAEVTSRFINTFSEVRILMVKVSLYPLSASNGVTTFWFDEVIPGSSPTFLDSRHKSARVICNSNGSGNSNYSMTFRPNSTGDLDFVPVGNPASSGSWNWYTDTTNYGSPASTTLYHYKMEYDLQFRGFV